MNNLTKRQVFWYILLISLGLIIWGWWGRFWALESFQGGSLFAKMFLYFGVQYAFVLWYYWHTSGKDMRKTFAFALVIMVIWSLSFGMPFVYDKNGFSGQTLGLGTSYSDDALLGEYLESSFFGCSSMDNSDMPDCTSGQTEFIYAFLSIVLPILSLIVIFLILNYRSVMVLLREGF